MREDTEALREKLFSQNLEDVIYWQQLLFELFSVFSEGMFILR